jgi:AraC-like DNA-binding protein
MIFDGSFSEFTIIDVLKIKRNGAGESSQSEKRPIGYLSCRLSGFSEIMVDGKTLRLDTEQYLICPPFAEYTQYYYKEELITVHLEFAKNPPDEIEIIYNTSPEVKKLFFELHTLWTEKQPGYIYKCKAVVYNILYLFQTFDCKKMNSRIRPSMDYLYTNYLSSDFSIDEMIARSFMSAAYFRRFFRELYGCSIVEFVKKLRIEQAKSLLESRRYTVGQIALMTGFSDEKYFSLVFRKTVGCAPSRYVK